MRFLNRDLILKYSPLLVSLFFLSLIIISAPLYLADQKTSSKVNVRTEKGSNQPQPITENSNEGNSKSSVKAATDTNTTPNGTCKVTKNGVTQIVPAGQVNVTEKSSGDISVKVECNNSTSSADGSSSNKTSIKNSINVNVNSSN